MALKLPDSAVPMGDFPVAKAVDIDFDDGENLQEKLDDGKLGGGSGSSEKQIKDWVSGSSYLEGDYIYHEGELYRCLASNNDVDFDETNWEQLTYIDLSGYVTKTEIANLNEYKQNKTDDTLTTTDKTITGAINEVNGNLLDTVGFSADYKNIILNRKNGLNPYTIPISAIINNTSLSELKDIDSTDVGNGKTLVYDSSIQKHKYVNTTGTDEFVKMDGTTDANYLSNLIDKSTVVNDNGVLKVKKLDRQEVTITEINYLKGLTMNIMDLVNAFSNGGVKVLNTPLNTASELDTMDRTSFIDGISYIVYVLADENHSGAKTTYLVDKTNTTFFGNADNQRNFITNPIDLANEVTGKLGTSNIDVDGLWTLLTINDTYKTLTTNNEVFGTHGAKVMYDELTTAIGKKANTSDIPTKVSELTNDSNYQTAKQVNSALENKANKTELNNYSYLGNLATRILKKDDLNNYITPGIYTCSSIDIAKTLLNLPTGIDSSFRLEVIINTGDKTNPYGSQEIRTNSNKNFIRTIRGTGGWSSWLKIATQKDVDELFQSVSSGKTLVANAITGKGVSTATTATFATMATNISKIPQTTSWKEETVSAAAHSTTHIAKFIFSNTVLGVRQLTPSGYHYIAEVKGTKMFTITSNCVEVYFPDGGTWQMTAVVWNSTMT